MYSKDNDLLGFKIKTSVEAKANKGPAKASGSKKPAVVVSESLLIQYHFAYG